MEPRSCDTFVVLPPLTAHGGVVFGKNSDRPQGEVQEVIFEPARDYSPGTMLECTYISVEQVSHTHAVILSKPAWMWGAEMGANERGVVVGNEAVWTKLSGPRDLEERLLGMDLVRLALERGGTAEEALDVITGLLERHGQGGPCSDAIPDFSYHNSFLIADPAEAWVLETAGGEWAAERVAGGCRNISNNLTIGVKIDKCSQTLRETAQKNGFWDGQGDFHFAAVYGDSSPGQLECGRQRSGRELLLKHSAESRFSACDMFSVLRDEPSGICRDASDAFPTTGSQVSVLSPVGSNKPHCHWFTATPNPKLSVFKPFIFTPNAKISKHTQSPRFDPDPAKEVPRFRRAVDRSHTLYRLHSAATAADRLAVTALLQDMEQSCLGEVEGFLRESAGARSLGEVGDLFKDVVEAEVRFYK
ncbi:secernin-2 isoform X2 [Bacillus rossius redtenbacheri]